REVLNFKHDYRGGSLAAGSARRDMVSQLMVRLKGRDDAPQVVEKIDTLFENAPDPTTTESEGLFLLNFISFLGNIKLFIAAICGAVTFTILLVSGNTLSMSVRERVRAVGILKTLGFTPSAILGISLAEPAVLAFTAATIC